MSSTMPLHPLLFEPIYKEKVWGGRALEKLGRRLPGDDQTLIGESWELADLGVTSASGGGGGEARSRISHGPLAGRTLHELMNQYGPALMGDLMPSEFGEFPLLVKYLDAHQNLSVQVHPSMAYLEKNDDAFLKSEAWYIVAAQPGAVIYKGMQQGVTAEQLRAALEVNTAEAVEPLLVKVPVQAGDCHYLPSGTCHALGGGVLVAEVQTPSDTTFRVFDWGRQGRELHVEEALQCIDFGPAGTEAYEPRITVDGAFARTTRLVTCEHFIVDEIRCPAGHEQAIAYDEPVVWMLIQGQGGLQCAAGGQTPLQQGQTLLIPPALTEGSVRFDSETVLLEVSFPQARRVQIA